MLMAHGSAIGATSPDPAALIARLARPAPASTAFTEVRFVAMLKAPLRLRGTLTYAADGALVRQVESPYRETSTIAAGEVRILRAGRAERRVPLERAPALHGFLESFAALLTGDAVRAARGYALSASGDAAAWRLELIPNDPALARQVRRITVDGREAAIRCFSVEETGGDASVMLVEALAGTTLPAAPTRAALDALCRATP